MYIQNNSYLTPTTKVITPYNCSMIAKNGVNISGKVSLAGLEMPYDSFYVSNISLASGQTDYHFTYGTLDSKATFLLIKVTYITYNDISKITSDDDSYLEYYFVSEPSVKHTLGKIMMLSGNATHKLEEICLNNPSGYDVSIEIMVGDLKSKTTTTNTSGNQTIDGLYYNSIITDIVNSGSTQFQILNTSGQTVFIIPYQICNGVTVFNFITVENNILTISLSNGQKVYLKFLTDFDAIQAYSRMSWVFESKINRYLTTDNPPVDILAPVITFNSAATYTFVSGTTLTKSYLKSYFISSVVDNQDGVINITNVDLTIRKENSLIYIDSISEIGTYVLLFSIADLATNKTSIVKTLYVTENVTQLGSPIITGITSSQSSLIFDWNNVLNNSGYEYQLSNDGNIWSSSLTLTTDITSTTVSGLTPNTVKFFKIKTLGNNTLFNSSDFSIAVSGITNDIIILNAPIVSGSTIPQGLNFSWNNVLNNSGYSYQISDDGNVWYSSSTLNQNVTSFNLTGLTPNTIKYFEVLTIGDGIFNSSSTYSNIASAITSNTIQLNTPITSGFTSGETALLFTWSNILNNSGYSYQISDDGNVWSTNSILPQDSTFFHLTGLTSGTTQFFRILANGDYINYSDSDFSIAVSATTFYSITGDNVLLTGDNSALTGDMT